MFQRNEVEGEDRDSSLVGGRAGSGSEVSFGKFLFFFPPLFSQIFKSEINDKDCEKFQVEIYSNLEKTYTALNCCYFFFTA